MMRQLFFLCIIAILGSNIANGIDEVADTPDSISNDTSPQKCCQFESATVCGWTPFFSSDGWHWSGFKEPNKPVPSYSGFYIWAEDLSATVESDLILGVTDETTIAFDYYLSSSAELPQHVYFQNGLEPVLLGVLDVTGEWTTFNYTCEADVVCPNKTQDSCAGKVTIVSNNQPGQYLVLAIDNFNVDNGCVPQHPWCCNFDSGDVCYWDLFYSSTGWHWSTALEPSIPVPDPGTSYIWTEDESATVTSTPLEGITSDTVFTVNYYFYTQYNYADNNVKFLFQTNTTSVALKTVGTSDSVWHQLVVPCTSACCDPGITCNGQFVISTSNIPGNKEVTAIDNFSVNEACVPTTTTPAPTTTPPPPSEWCCGFESPEVCYWSLYYQSTGWLWSGYVTPSLYIPPHESDYIFVQDDSADVFSQKLPGIQTGTTFNLTYYFSSATYDINNKLGISFTNEFLYSSTFIDSLPHNTDWTTITVACDSNCCKGGIEPCTLEFHVTTTNSPMTNLVAAIDDFSVNDQVC